MENKTYTFTCWEDGQRYPCATVTPLGNGLAIYGRVGLYEETIPVDEAFAKARETAALLNSRY
jgi:hypothetical protein